LNSPVYHETLRNIGYFITSSSGSSGGLVDKQSQFILMSHVTRQSFVQAIDDDFLLAAVITMVCAIPVIFLKIGRKGRGKNSGKVSIQHQNIGGEEPLRPLTAPSEAKN
jgi:DHA2 family multidrug resistance protein